MEVKIKPPSNGDREANIKCDVLGCDWKKDIPVSQTSLHEAVKPYLNEPCPKCHRGILITQKAMDEAKQIDELVALDKEIREGFDELGLPYELFGASIQSSK